MPIQNRINENILRLFDVEKSLKKTGHTRRIELRINRGDEVARSNKQGEVANSVSFAPDPMTFA
jgi:hypothetical protein